ncbi:hypothetical protein Ahy_A09g044829 [Arachis hypogaea]|uniref:Pentatricopeptide repeat-containing protein n=1 Tax=Arachis hypogaea TaxID=3818 RepID=A0A445BKX8_ARAHY|nr:hypothetical protein Ahy_A09g044829 [Arachis hypogaea]
MLERVLRYLFVGYVYGLTKDCKCQLTFLRHAIRIYAIEALTSTALPLLLLQSHKSTTTFSAFVSAYNKLKLIPITITTIMCSTIFPTTATGKWPKLFMHTTFPLMASSQVLPSISTPLPAMSLSLRGSSTSSIPVRDIYSLIILSFSCTQGMGYSKIHSVLPDQFTLAIALSICSKLRNVEFGTLLHSCMIKAGFVSNPFCQGALIDLYAKCSFFCHASAKFDTAFLLDTVSWMASILGYV